MATDKDNTSNKGTTRRSVKSSSASAPSRRASDATPKYRTRPASSPSKTGPTPKAQASSPAKTGAVAKRSAAAGSRSGAQKPKATKRQAPKPTPKPKPKSTAKNAPKNAPKNASKNAPKGKKPSQKGAKNVPQGKQGPANRTKSNGAAFKDFYLSHLKLMIPATLVVAFIVIGGIVDIATSIGKIHPGIEVQGVKVGGMTVEEAAIVLEEELTPLIGNSTAVIYSSTDSAASEGVSFTDDKGENVAYADEYSFGSDLDGDATSDKWTVTPSSIGAYVDGTALAEDAYLVGRKGNVIFDRMGAWLGLQDREAVLATSGEYFPSLVAEINGAIGWPITECGVSIEEGVATTTEGNDGWLVNEEILITQISHAFFNQDKPNVLAPMETAVKHINEDTAQRVCDKMNQALAQSITITYEDEAWVLAESELGDLLTTKVLEPETFLMFGDGTQVVGPVEEDDKSVYDLTEFTDAQSGWILQPYVCQEWSMRYLAGKLGDKANGGAVNAWFDTSSGEVVIQESQTGIGPDRAAASVQMQDMLFGTVAERTIGLVDTEIQPSFSTEDAEAMGITEKLATWSIPLSGSSSRINNITRLTELINYKFVAPGETWSFNDTTGERTAENGFETAPVIINGKHEDQLGGGICQVATCVYNAACYSGLGIQSRTNHTSYIPAYDDYGFADATVSWTEPNLAFVNDMDTYILITAGVTDEIVYVTFWGTKDGREVTCDRGEWRDGAEYAVVEEEDETVPAGQRRIVQGGVNGRSIDIHYVVVKDGVVIHDINFHSVYEAQNEIWAVHPGEARSTE